MGNLYPICCSIVHSHGNCGLVSYKADFLQWKSLWHPSSARCCETRGGKKKTPITGAQNVVVRLFAHVTHRLVLEGRHKFFGCRKFALGIIRDFGLAWVTPHDLPSLLYGWRINACSRKENMEDNSSGGQLVYLAGMKQPNFEQLCWAVLEGVLET